jgi:hypothetical protein
LNLRSHFGASVSALKIPFPGNGDFGSKAVLTREEIDALPEGWDSRSLLVVAVPLNLRKRFIQQKLGQMLRRHHKRKRGQRTFKESRARYPIATQFKFSQPQTDVGDI